MNIESLIETHDVVFALHPSLLTGPLQVSKLWRHLLSSPTLIKSALSHHFPDRFNSQTARVDDPALALSVAAKPLHAFKTGRPVKKASFRYTSREAMAFFAGNCTGVFADYFQSMIAWNDGPNIRTLCLRTGATLKLRCGRTRRLSHLKLSDQLVVAVTYDR